jgi:hypothetical protein
MFTLLSTLISFLAGGLPKLLDFFQDKSDKKHELELAQMQTERELEMRKLGFEAQTRVEEIKMEGQMVEAASAERQALYAHDIAIGEGASQWVVNMRALVRPVITYGLFFTIVGIDIGAFIYAFKNEVPFDILISRVMDDEFKIVWSSVVAFWFGSQAFQKK